MPKAAAPATVALPLTAEALRLAVTLGPDDETIAERYHRIRQLLGDATNAGLEIPEDVATLLPDVDDLTSEYLAVHAAFSQAEKQKKLLAAALIPIYDTTKTKTLSAAGGKLLTRIAGCSAPSIDAAKLFEKGVSPAVVEYATKPGTPFYQIRVSDRKAE